jgi:hypothetical protein
MSRKRSTYRPKPVMTDPLSILRPADPARRAMVMARFLTALDAMASGQHPGEADWRDLSDAINTVETLALHQGKLVPAEVMPTITAAIAAMVGAARRHQAGQRMGLTGEGLRALRDVLGIYETCLDGLTEREVCMAQAETQRRVNALLRSHRTSPMVVAL